MRQLAAARMAAIEFSSIRKVFEQVDRLSLEGRQVAPFHIGRPDFDTPSHIKEAAKLALDEGHTAYTSNYGLLELRRAISEKLRIENGIDADPERQIIVTVGANEAVLMAMLGLLNPDDEVLIPDPMWLHYPYCARLAGVRVVSVPLSQERGFELDPDEFKSRITARTRMVVLNSPHNPTGAVWSREAIKEITSLAEEHDLLVLSDEIYERILYEGAEHISPGSLPEGEGRTLTIGGFSKSYAMTGWRLGYVAAPSWIIDVLIRVHQYTTVCATSFAQYGALAALTGPQECVEEMVAQYRERRQVVIDGFSEIDGQALVPPRGAFYAFPRVSALGESSVQVAEELLRGANVAVVPGVAFGENGEGHIRISYACSVEQVAKGLASIRAYWADKVAKATSS